jgi:hypothetical protein
MRSDLIKDNDLLPHGIPQRISAARSICKFLAKKKMKYTPIM